MRHHIGKGGYAVDDLAVMAADQIQVIARRPTCRRNKRTVGSHRHRIQLAVVARTGRWSENRQERAAGGIPDAGGLVFGRGDGVATVTVHACGTNRRHMAAGFDAQAGRGFNSPSGRRTDSQQAA